MGSGSVLHVILESERGSVHVVGYGYVFGGIEMYLNTSTSFSADIVGKKSNLFIIL